MRLSIIVPVYNAYKFIDRCIESLVNQTTAEKYEIILINDCSTDDSIVKLNEWQEQYPNKITVIDSKVNMRQGGARNLGLKIAKGDYILFVDSDDHIAENAVKLLLSQTKETEYDLVYGRTYYIDSQEGITTHTYSRFIDSIDVSIDERKQIIMGDFIGVWNGLYKRQMLIENNIEFEKNIFFEDVLFTHQVAFSLRSLKSFDTPFYYYFTNMDSTTNKKDDARRWEALKIYGLMLKYGLEKDKAQLFTEEIEGTFIVRSIRTIISTSLYAFNRVPYDKAKAEFKQVKKQFPEYQKNKYYCALSKAEKSKINFFKTNPRLYVFCKKVRLGLKSILKRKNVVVVPKEKK